MSETAAPRKVGFAGGLFSRATANLGKKHDSGSKRPLSGAAGSVAKQRRVKGGVTTISGSFEAQDQPTYKLTPYIKKQNQNNKYTPNLYVYIDFYQQNCQMYGICIVCSADTTTAESETANGIRKVSVEKPKEETDKIRR